MASIVSICNLALSRINARKIQSLSDSIKEARECDLHYENARDAVLADHDWGFARKRLDLSLLTDTYSGWTYAYMYPTDCITFRKIYDGIGASTGTSYDWDEERWNTTGDNIKYEIAAESSLNYKVILTEEEDAEGIYTARITNPTMFPPIFVSALAYKLAQELAIPLKADSKRLENMATLYYEEIRRAKASSGNEDNNKRTTSCSFITARS